MLSRGDRVLAAVSGGPDSMAMLHFLSIFPGIKPAALHVNHGIRGREAEKDALSVKEYCKERGIPFILRSFDVPSHAKKKKISLEEAGREIRYRVLENTAKKIRADKIALAHNADDNVETFIMRLMRGTGLRGLCGIPPVRGRIVRPLLDVWKKEVLEYCRKHNVPFRTDKTNFSTKFTRNKIRHLIIPMLEKEDPRLKHKVLRYIKSFLKDYTLLNRKVEELSKKLLKRTGEDVRIEKKKLLSLPEGLKGFMVREAIERLNGNLLNIEEVHISDILSLERGYICLPNGLFAAADSSKILITKKKPGRAKAVIFKYELRIPGYREIRESGTGITAEIVKAPRNFKNIKSNEAYLDASKIKGGLTVRNFRKGDFFVPLGMKGRKKLQDFFVDLKVPVEERKRIPIVCDREKVVWIAGKRIDDRVKLDNKTVKFVKLSVI